MQVENYHIHAALTGRHVRIATKVILPEGQLYRGEREIRFMDRLSKRKAIRQAQLELGR